MQLKIKFLQESNAIEGIDFPERLYDQAYKLWPNGEMLTDNLHILNATQALKFIEKNRTRKKFIVADVLHLHKLLTEGLQPDAGQLRTCRVMVGHYMPPVPSVLYYHMDDLVFYMNSPDADMLRTHGMFEAIHPFSDGNGRTGRMLWAWQRLTKGLPIRPILSQFKGKSFAEKRLNYYRMLSEGRTQP